MVPNVFSQGWLIAGIVVCIAISFAFAFFRMRLNIGRRLVGIQRKSRLFSVSERKFFESLSDALDYDYHIFAKVGVLEILEHGQKMSKSHFKRLSKDLEAERFDYVVCKKSDLSVSAVIELECFDRRISRARKQKRNTLISELCKASKLRLFYFDTRQDYLGMDIRRLITGSSKCAKNVSKKQEKLAPERSEMTVSHSMMTENIGQNSCPDCHSELVTKVAVKGKHIGERFLMCRKYPYCEYRILLKDANVLNLRTASSKTSERKGFSGWAG